MELFNTFIKEKSFGTFLEAELELEKGKLLGISLHKRSLVCRGTLNKNTCTEKKIKVKYKYN